MAMYGGASLLLPTLNDRNGTRLGRLNILILILNHVVNGGWGLAGCGSGAERRRLGPLLSIEPVHAVCRNPINRTDACCVSESSVLSNGLGVHARSFRSSRS